MLSDLTSATEVEEGLYDEDSQERSVPTPHCINHIMLRSFAILKMDLQKRNGFENNNSLNMDYLNNKSEKTFKNYNKEKEGTNMLIIRINIVYNHRIIFSSELPGNQSKKDTLIIYLLPKKKWNTNFSKKKVFPCRESQLFNQWSSAFMCFRHGYLQFI